MGKQKLTEYNVEILYKRTRSKALDDYFIEDAKQIDSYVTH